MVNEQFEEEEEPVVVTEIQCVEQKVEILAAVDDY
jgi:hypothetical protein